MWRREDVCDVRHGTRRMSKTRSGEVGDKGASCETEVDTFKRKSFTHCGAN